MTTEGPARRSARWGSDRRRGAVGADDSGSGSLHRPRLVRRAGSRPGRVPHADWPPVNITHLRSSRWSRSAPLLALVVVVFWLAPAGAATTCWTTAGFCGSVIAGPLAVLALEFGWIATEVGRQPWAVWQVLRDRRRGQPQRRLVVELYPGADRLPRHDHRRLRGAAFDGQRWRAGDEICRARTGRPGRRRDRRVSLADGSRRWRCSSASLSMQLFGGADFGSRLLRSDRGCRRRGGELRYSDRSQHRAGVGGQPCLADLHPGDLVDRVSRRVRRGDDDTVHPLMLALGRDRVARCEFRVSQVRRTFAQARFFGAIFAGSSLIAPFFLGTVAGAIASGRVPADGYGDPDRLVGQPDVVGRGCPSRGHLHLPRRSVPDRGRRPRRGHRPRATLRLQTLAVGVGTGLLCSPGCIRSSTTRRRSVPACSAMPFRYWWWRPQPGRNHPAVSSKLLGSKVPAAVAVGAVITGWGVGQYPWMLVDSSPSPTPLAPRPRWPDSWWSSGWPPSSCCPRWDLLWLTQTEEWSRA